MSQNTSIEWTETTWNPVRGCSRISPGCEHCYAERIAARFGGRGDKFEGFVHVRPLNEGTAPMEQYPAYLHDLSLVGKWTGRVELLPDKLTEPLRWRKPRRVFVNSMSDLFHENLPDEAIDQVFAVMALCPQHTFQVLTKRARRMREYCNARIGKISDAIVALRQQRGDNGVVRPLPSLPPGAHWYPLPWVHLGVSVENQKYADERIPDLLRTPAAVRWISAEPLLERIRIWKLASLDYHENTIGYETYPLAGMQAIPDCDWEHTKLSWVVIGAESGPGARPFDLAWARSIVQQCKSASVPLFVKQLGSKPYVETIYQHPLKLSHHKGGDPSEWPEDLRVREYPGCLIPEAK